MKRFAGWESFVGMLLTFMLLGLLLASCVGIQPLTKGLVTVKSRDQYGYFIVIEQWSGKGSAMLQQRVYMSPAGADTIEVGDWWEWHGFKDAE